MGLGGEVGGADIVSVRYAHVSTVYMLTATHQGKHRLDVSTVRHGRVLSSRLLVAPSLSMRPIYDNSLLPLLPGKLNS